MSVFMIQNLGNPIIRQDEGSGLTGAYDRHLDPSFALRGIFDWLAPIGDGDYRSLRQGGAACQHHDAVLYLS